MNMPKNKKPQATFEIPVEGSLGLLALGAVGLRMWRKVRNEAKGTSIPESPVREGGAQ